MPARRIGDTPAIVCAAGLANETPCVARADLLTEQRRARPICSVKRISTPDNTTPIAVAPQRGHIVAIRRERARSRPTNCALARAVSASRGCSVAANTAACARPWPQLKCRRQGNGCGSSVARVAGLTHRPAHAPEPHTGCRRALRVAWPTPRAPCLYVVASWRDRHGVSRCTRYSVERHGLQGALDKAIAARISAGAPLPDRSARCCAPCATSVPRATDQACQAACIKQNAMADLPHTPLAKPIPTPVQLTGAG
jgi:hypothetical protein